MNVRDRFESDKHKTSSQTWRFKGPRPGVAALIALAAAITVPLAEAQQEGAKPYPVSDTRDMRFCEFLVINEGMVDIYNTTGLNDCPAELWDALDLEKLAKEFGAEKLQKNGPKYWMMDSQTVSFGETASFGGIEARWAARIPASFFSGDKGTSAYETFTTKKTQRMVYDKGKSVFELVDPDGKAYVLQARGEKSPIGSLAELGDKMTLPAGWQYRSRVLEEDLVLDLTPDQTIYAVGDEFHQYYTLPPKTE